jgi:hypothetical protein
MEAPLNAGTDGILDIRDPGGRLCGRYHYDDPYKSFFRGLYTPKGVDVVSPQPQDHPHHKGLQYGLSAKDVNFWEEDAKTEPGHRRIGRQVTEKLEQFGNGFSQQVVWRDDVCVSFNETRRISVQPTASGYAWRWDTTLTAVRDVELIVSAWLVDGRYGYVGLGLRLFPDLFWKKSTVTVVPAQPPALGIVAQRVAVRGASASLTFEQDPSQQNALYFQGCEPGSPDDFAFASLGPTNAHGLTVENGDSLKGSYLITVADAD